MWLPKPFEHHDEMAMTGALCGPPNGTALVDSSRSNNDAAGASCMCQRRKRESNAGGLQGNIFSRQSSPPHSLHPNTQESINHAASTAQFMFFISDLERRAARQIPPSVSHGLTPIHSDATRSINPFRQRELPSEHKPLPRRRSNPHDTRVMRVACLCRPT